MKKTLRIMGLCALVALAATACKKEAQTTSSLRATLTQPTSDAKTGINSSLELVWNEGDQIKVFDNNGEAYIFTTTEDGTKTATFTGSAELDESLSYLAFYPADNASLDGNTIKLDLNASQTYVSHSFAAGTYPMIAKSEAGVDFTFTSDCGLLAIPVSGSGSIGSIELTGKNNENLAGQLQYTTGGDFNFFDGSSNKVTLDCGGVSLGSDATVFYFVLPANVFANGFTAELKDIMGVELGSLSTVNDNTIVAKNIRMMPAVTVGQPGLVISVDTLQTSSSATSNQCTLMGSVTYDPGLVLDEVGFYYGAAAKGLNELPANLVNKVTLNYVPASSASFSYTLDNLAEGTDYQYCVYVKTGEQETYGALENFTTLASDPLAPDFENGIMPKGWTPNGNNSWYVGTEDYYGYAPAYAGSYSLYVDGNGAYDSDYFVSPALVFDGSAASLSFAYATPDWEGDHNDLSVCYGTSPNGPWNYTSFVWVNSSSWTTATVDLSSLNGTYYIAFESYDGYGYCTAIDNITFTGVSIGRGNITAATNGNGAGIGAGEGLTAKPDQSAPARTRANHNQQRIKIKK